MKIRTIVVAFPLMLAAASAASGQNPFPPYHVERTKILLTGEPAPGIDGATVSFLFTPQIDGAGNVLIDGYVTGPGITAANNRAVWHGSAGNLSLVVREGSPAPGVPGAFIAEGWTVYLSESGIVAISCFLSGPGVQDGVTDLGTFAGPPEALQRIVQAGDPAPSTEPGTVFASNIFFGVQVSDNGALLLNYDLAGPAIDSSNDRAMYIGYPDNPQLIWRRGMQAPGCEEGVLFGGADGVVFNDNDQVAFRCSLMGAGVTSANNSGYWAGSPESLELIARKGFQAPALPPGVNLFGTSFPGINYAGWVAFWGGLSGAGVDGTNNHALWVGSPAAPQLVARRGDPAPDAPDGTVMTVVTVSGNKPINNLEAIAFEATPAGPDVTSENDFAAYLRTSEGTRLVLRESQMLAQFGSGVALGQGSSKFALTDLGDVVTSTLLSGVGVNADNDNVAWIRRPSGWWVPLIRSGDILDGRVVLPGSAEEVLPIPNSTGGGDAVLQFANDHGAVAGRLVFGDGACGIYVVQGSHVLDVELDGDIDLSDYAEFPSCFGGPVGVITSDDCERFDIDLSGHIDLGDAQVLQEAFSGVTFP